MVTAFLILLGVGIFMTATGVQLQRAEIARLRAEVRFRRGVDHDPQL
nr:hypothetical protein [Sphingomonas populi]